ncbi:tetratricopeptide repeat-containing sulfotransferase family protein [Arsukibacterium perlucidum]|uniref:tetratricopeptide repeat-containing sulfotransferase family protein n=1 Tax=Arsukibacterium perlucidum TaxID=368811 RepID=UPI00037FC659|nr:tetratricopeptide repeat-containing sulfotransferase family protein [Arsukibacterium perlucidum]
MLKSEFQRALNLFNNNELNAAAAACQPYLEQPMFKLLLATIYGKLARFNEAEVLFENLLRQYPINLDVLFNFALVLKLQQRFTEAEQHLKSCLRLNVKYHPAHHALGALAELNHDLIRARACYQHALSVQPENMDYVYSLAQCAFKQDDFAMASQLLQSLLQRRYHAAAFSLFSAVLYKLKSTVAMRQLAERYAKEIITVPDALKYAGLLELDEKCFVSALHLLQQAQQQLNEPCFEVDANLLYCKYLLRPEKMLLQQLIECSVSDGSTTAFYFVVNVLATLGQLEQAKSLLQQALPQYPNDTALRLLQSRLFIQLKQPTEALNVLSGISQSQDNETLLEICYQKVQLFENMGEYTLAADQIKAAAKLVATQRIVENLQQDASRAEKDINSVAVKLNAHPKQLVFIIGFPRSGTTLLESKLAQLDNVKILEETNAVKQFYLHLLQLSKGRELVEYLSGLTEPQRIALANDYLTSLSKYTELRDEHIIVDKMPLNALYLTPMLLLFPQAKVVLMQRHPMDVCISSLKQRMLNLFTVDAFAQSYDTYFSLLDIFLHKFNENTLVIKYEQLVTDYFTVFNSVLQHCGVSTAKQQQSDTPTMFNTPSYHQVSQPLYTKAVNSYQHYQKMFDFQHPRLIKWCKALGYGDGKR